MSTQIENFNAIHQRLMKLRAMLAVAFGDTGEVFRESLSDEDQDSYFWQCYDLAREACNLLESNGSTGNEETT